MVWHASVSGPELKTKTDNGLLIRIDEPVDGSTRFRQTLPIRGWIAASRSERDELASGAATIELYIERIINRDSLLYNGVSFIGVSLTTKSSSLPFLLAPLSIAEPSITLPAVEVGEGRQRVEFRGEINLSGWGSTDQARMFRLLANYKRDGAATLSNQIVVSVAPTETWDAPFAGFAAPGSDCALKVERALFEVWAAKRNDPPESAELVSGERRFPMLRSEAPEAAKVEALPDVGASNHARFVVSVSSRELLANEGSFQLVPLHAEVKYRSGLVAPVVAPTVRLSAPSERDGQAEIELLRVVPSGNIEIGGVLTMPGVGAVRTFLEARSWRIELHSADTVPRIHWQTQRIEETTEPYLSDRHSRFLAVFSPDALGPTPGAVRIVFERGDSRVVAGPPAQLMRISKLMAAPVPKQALSTLLCRVGQRRSFSQPRRGSATGTTLVASPNLSAVEGAPKVLCEVVSTLRKERALEFTVVAGRDGALRRRYEALGIQVKVFDQLSGERNSWELYHETLEQVAALSGERPFRGVLANVIDSFWAIDFARRQTLPTAWIVHESIPPESAFPGVDSRLRLLFLEALRVVNLPLFVSARTAELFEARLQSRPVVIPNGVDSAQLSEMSGSVDKQSVRDELGIPRDAKVISIIGTTTRRKGQDLFLREMAVLKAQHAAERLHFLIVGAREVPFLQELKDAVRELGLEREVLFIPEQAGVERYFAISDVVVIASREESAPLVSLEAFAHGVPLVSSRVFGLAEQIEDESNALAFELEREGHLAAQVARLLTDSGLRSRLISQARLDVETRFSQGHSMARYTEELGKLF